MLLSAQRIAELQTALDAANTNLAAITGERDQLTASNATLTQQLADAGTQITSLTADLAAARTQLQNQADGEEARVSAEVTKRLSDAGTDPIKRDSKASDHTPAGGASSAAKDRALTNWSRDFGTRN